uniref:VTT domain-containing protein n=1 Tax=Megaselia scalaris TaxID=36166 RepID=T1GSW7_MEGSC
MPQNQLPAGMVEYDLSSCSLQTFAIPGSLFLSILLGFLYKFPVALSLICFSSAFGASLCYLLASVVGRPLILHYCSSRTTTLTNYVNKHKDSLFNLMLFLRITPILPNWLINLCAPVVGVPLYPFVLGTFFGVAPPSVLAIQAGKTLQTMTTASGTFSWTNVAILSASAALAIVPIFFKNKVKNKLE